MYHDILVPTDGSKLSEKAVETGAKLAKTFGARLHILHVRPPLDRAPFAEGAATIYVPKDQARKQIADEEWQLLSAVEQVAKACGISAETEYVLSSSPYQAIVRVAQERKCDLIVMASHGRRGISALILGSETQKVLTHSTIPVFVVR
jgi:nucleotide-binding universal stress UspA family protein